MICLIALVVFGVLAIFSAAYRPLAKEAFDCVFRKMTFRPCRGDLNVRLKGQITGKIMRHHRSTGRWIYRHFELLSWIFTIMLFASLAYSGYSMYNFVKYGNCNGQESREFCVFDALVGPTFEDSDVSLCTAPGQDADPFSQILVAPDVSGMQYVGPEDAPVELIEFGCYTCPYTRASQDLVDKILDKYEGKIKFVFIHMPISSHANSMEAAISSDCAEEQGMFIEYHDKLFSEPDAVLDVPELKRYASDVGLDAERFNTCLDTQATKEKVDAEIAMGKTAGVYGTPTFFVNGRPVVGPQDYTAFKKIIEEELDKQVK